MSDSITALLVAHRQGDIHAFDQLFPLVYEDLKRVAGRQRRRCRRMETLNTTALVHDVYVRLVDERRIAWESRAHFLAIAARAMRQILVDRVRERVALKRGGEWQRVELATDALPLREDWQLDGLLALDDAFCTLATISGRLVRVAECRLFAGMTDRETSAALSIPLRTAQREWQRARAWLQHELSSSTPA